MKKQSILGVIIAATLLLVLGFFIYKDLNEGGQNDDGNGSLTSTTTGDIVSDDDFTESEGALPDIPPPGLDREFVIPDVYGEELIENTMKEYERIIKVLREDKLQRNEWLQLAILRNAVEDYEGAEEIWLYTTQVWPLDHVSYGNLANLYTTNLVDLEKAEEFYAKALDRRPDNLNYVQNLYNLYRFQLEKPDQALNLLLQGRDFFPDEIFYPVRLGEHYRDSGDKAKARESFSAAVVLAGKLDLPDIKAYAEGELEKL